MKQTLTILALAAAGISQAQNSGDAKNLLRAIRRTATVTATGADAILRSQTHIEAAKTTANFYRITGWSRYDLAAGAFVDSSTYRYSGTRASRFADEHENMNAGKWNFLSQADYSAASRDGGPLDRSEVESKYTPSNLKTEVIFREPMWNSRSTLTYNTAGQELTNTEFDSTNGSWMAVRRYQHTYNSAGLPVSTQIVELPGGAPEGRIIRHYDASGHEDSVSTSMWTGAGYFEIHRTITSWSGKGEQLSVTNFNLDEDMVMQPGDRSEYSYDAASMLSTSTTSVFDGGVWINQTRDSFGYTGSKPLYTFKRSLVWDDGAGDWQAMREWNYSLNARNKWSSETFKTPGGGAVLEPQTRTDFSYDAQDLIIMTETFQYDRAQQTYETTPMERERFYYELGTPTGVDALAKSPRISAWPNPASDQLHIEAGADRIEAVEILSATGQRVFTEVSGGKRLDVSKLPAGNYFLRAQLRATAAPVQIRFVKM